MSPILMTREERRLLLELLKYPLPANKVPKHVISKFTRHSLVAKEAFRCKITLKGQVEAMRRRFCNMARWRVVTVTDESFRERFNRPWLTGHLGARILTADETEE